MLGERERSMLAGDDGRWSPIYLEGPERCSAAGNPGQAHLGQARRRQGDGDDGFWSTTRSPTEDPASLPPLPPTAKQAPRISAALRRETRGGRAAGEPQGALPSWAAFGRVGGSVPPPPLPTRSTTVARYAVCVPRPRRPASAAVTFNRE